MKKGAFKDLLPRQGKAETKPADTPPGEGKRRQGHIQLSVLIPPGVRDDLRMGINFDPDKRDLSELVTDLLTEWLDSLPSGYQDVRPSRRQDD